MPGNLLSPASSAGIRAISGTPPDKNGNLIVPKISDDMKLPDTTAVHLPPPAQALAQVPAAPPQPSSGNGGTSAFSASTALASNGDTPHNHSSVIHARMQMGPALASRASRGDNSIQDDDGRSSPT